MSQATGILNAHRAPHVRVVGAVSGAHFVSHYYIILLAPLLPFVRADYGVSYTEIGLAFAAFNIVSATLQTPAGFLVDRLGARVPLIGGLLLGGAAFIIAGLVHSFWVLVAMFALAGLGNTVYHPADYAMLSQNVSSKHIGQAFSVHTFAGMLGGAVAPPTLLLMHGLWGWRGAFVGGGMLGLAMAAIARQGPTPSHRPKPRPTARAAPDGGCCCPARCCSISVSSPSSP
jgi:MFS transporter, FSR family, fosmidomycin resistance protein